MTPLLARPARITALVLAAAVALTAAGGGAALIAGSMVESSGAAIRPPDAFLAGSPFAGYLVPGLLLLIVVGGLHALAFAVQLRRSAWAPLATAVAAFGLLIWIFVQMIWIPFSPLQAAYEAFAIGELALLLVQYGVLDVLAPRREVARRAASRQRTA
ncbi:MAG: hypothetical protein ACTHJL_01975 [Amnibacterium sp.]